MDSGKATSGEIVPMVQINDRSPSENGDHERNDNMKTAPSSPALSIKNSEKRSETISIDVSGDVPYVKKKVTHEQSLSLLNPTDINSMLPDYMKNSLDTTYGGNATDPSATAAKKGSDAPDGFNEYRNQKSFSQGLLDIALFTSNVNQLRAVTKNPVSGFNFYFIVILLVFSVIFQIAVGLVLLLSSRYNVNKEEERKTVYTMGTWVVSGVFLITILNLIIAVFYDYDDPGSGQYMNNTSHP